MTRTLIAALNTVKSTEFTLFMARLLGKKLKIRDEFTNSSVNIIYWRGKEYLTNYSKG